MLFKDVLIFRIARGAKTQTRRPTRPGDTLCDGAVCHNGRIKIATGRDYAVQPGRGKPGLWWKPATQFVLPTSEFRAGHEQLFRNAGYQPMRICITSIRQEDVRTITHRDAISEGFPVGRIAFWQTWCAFYDPPMVMYLDDVEHDVRARSYLNPRPDELYQAWVYTFEVVR